MKGLLKMLLPGANTFRLLLSGLLLVFILSRKNPNTSTKRQMEYDKLIQSILISKGFSPNMARLVAAVSRHETGNYTSPVFQELNNMFGMRFPRQRKTTALHESVSKYSVYASPADSVADMALYFSARLFPTHFDSAYGLVKKMKEKGYFEDSFENYLAGVERALPKVASI